MESRKRPHSTEDEPTIQKKRILTGVNGTPHVNGVVSAVEEPNDTDNLEVKAIDAFFKICTVINICVPALSKRGYLSTDETLFSRT